VRAARHLVVGDLDEVELLGDDLPDVAIGLDATAALVDVGDLDGLADVQAPRVRLLFADDHPKQGRLADAVRTDDADDAGTRQAERQPVEQLPLAEALVQVRRLEDDVTQARTRGDVDLLEVELATALGLGRELLVTPEACLVLGLAGLRIGTHPLELLLEDPGTLRVLLALDDETLLLLLEVRRVVALVRVRLTAVELEDP